VEVSSTCDTQQVGEQAVSDVSNVFLGKQGTQTSRRYQEFGSRASSLRRTAVLCCCT
jgi:hypothetical protein